VLSRLHRFLFNEDSGFEGILLMEIPLKLELFFIGIGIKACKDLPISASAFYASDSRPQLA
jgi:hypothetical protein